MVKFKKPTSLFKCWLRNRNFTQNTLDTRCQIKSPMWPNRTWRFLGGCKSYRRFAIKSPSMIYPKSPSMIPPPKIVQFWAKFQTHTTSCFASQRSFLRKTNEGYAQGSISSHAQSKVPGARSLGKPQKLA